jgi:acyl carrier protein
MKIHDFIIKISEQFEETDPSIFSPNTKFKTLDEWSSMIALSIIAMCDDEFGKELSGEDIRSSETIQELFDILIGR